MSTRLLTLTTAAHPKAEVQSVDPAAGVLLFAFCDAQGQRLDSGNNVARFIPLPPLPQAEDYTGPAQYPEVDDATLVAAIENPPVPEPGRWRVLKDTIWMRVRDLGKREAATAALAQLPLANKTDWDCQSWFWCDNLAIQEVLLAIGCTAAEVAQILAPDPLAP